MILWFYESIVSVLTRGCCVHQKRWAFRGVSSRHNGSGSQWRTPAAPHLLTSLLYPKRQGCVKNSHICIAMQINYFGRKTLIYIRPSPSQSPRELMWDKTVLKTISMLEVELQELFISKPVMQYTPSWPRALNSWVSLHVGKVSNSFPNKQWSFCKPKGVCHSLYFHWA